MAFQDFGLSPFNSGPMHTQPGIYENTFIMWLCQSSTILKTSVTTCTQRKQDFWHCDSPTLFEHRVDGIVFEYRGRKSIHFHKCPATCVQGLN